MDDSGIEQRLPHGVRGEFRRVALASMLWDDPATWRFRRKDTFTDLDLLTYRNRFQIDFRIRRARVLRAVELLDAHLAQRNEEPQSDLRRRLSRLLDGDSALSEWSSADLFLPVMWIWGPPTELSISLDGEPVVPLNRRDTAGLVASVAVMIVEELRAADADVGYAPRELESKQLIYELYWHMAVSDWWSLSDDPVLRQVGLDWVYLGKHVCKRWIAERLSSIPGSNQDSVKQGLRDQDARIESLLESSTRVLQWLQDASAVPSKALRHPFWNPLMLLPTYLSRLGVWEGQSVDTAAVLDSYLAFCESCMNVLEWVAHSATPLSDFIWESLRDLAWCWPVVCRSSIALDTNHSFVGVWDMASRRASRHGWHSYDIAVADAESYHVDILADHAELELKPNSARVDVGFRTWRFWPFSWLEPSSQPFLRLLTRPRSREARRYFSRCTDSSPRIQSFYTSSTHRSDQLQGLIAALDSDGVMGPVQLIVKKNILDYVVATNWLFAISFFVAGIAALMVSVARLGGLLLIPWTAVLSGTRLAIPLLVAALALFTIERHNNPVVAKHLRQPWLLLVLSSVAILTPLIAYVWAAMTSWPSWGAYSCSPQDVRALCYAVIEQATALWPF